MVEPSDSAPEREDQAPQASDPRASDPRADDPGSGSRDEPWDEVAQGVEPNPPGSHTSFSSPGAENFDYRPVGILVAPPGSRDLRAAPGFGDDVVGGACHASYLDDGTGFMGTAHGGVPAPLGCGSDRTRPRLDLIVTPPARMLLAEPPVAPDTKLPRVARSPAVRRDGLHPLVDRASPLGLCDHRGPQREIPRSSRARVRLLAHRRPATPPPRRPDPSAA